MGRQPGCGTGCILGATAEVEGTGNSPCSSSWKAHPPLLPLPPGRFWVQGFNLCMVSIPLLDLLDMLNIWISI